MHRYESLLYHPRGPRKYDTSIARAHLAPMASTAIFSNKIQNKSNHFIGELADSIPEEEM